MEINYKHVEGNQKTYQFGIVQATALDKTKSSIALLPAKTSIKQFEDLLKFKMKQLYNLDI